MTDGSDVAPDGSPVELYLRLSGVREADLIETQLRRPSTVLDLGCGAGRIANELARRGHRVTGVDNSPAMLTHLVGVDAVEGDIIGLDLGRTFDAVLLWSYLVNTADRRRRHELVATCRRHVAASGIVLVWRDAPGSEPTSSQGEENGVVTTFRVDSRRGDHYRATTTYDFDGRRYEQAFEAQLIDDDAMAALASAHDLRVVDVLQPNGMLVRLAAATD